MVEKSYYWPDFKTTFTVKTKEGIERGFLIDESDCDTIIQYLMVAANHYMTGSQITDDVSYFKEHAFPYLPLYTYNPSILGGTGVFKYIIEVDLIQHVITILEHRILTSFAELILKSEGVLKESSNHSERVTIDHKKFEELYDTNDDKNPYKLFNDLRLALLNRFSMIYNARIYTEKTLNDLGMLQVTKEFLKSFQTYLNFADESATTYTHEELMDMLLQQMMIIAPPDFKESVETY